MNRFFNFGLYRQGIRKVRVLGIIGLVTTALFTLIYPILMLINYAPMLSSYSYGDIASEETLILPFLIISLPMMVMFLFAPLLVSNMFSFLRKRAPSDFYHSLPHGKVCMFISFFASCLTWVLATFIIVGLLAVSLYSVIPGISFNVWDVISSILGLFSFAFLLMSLSALAVSVTGTAFAWFASFAVIITAIPIYVILFLSSLSTLIPSFDGAALFLDPLADELAELSLSYNMNFDGIFSLFSRYFSSSLSGSSDILLTVTSVALYFGMLLTNPIRFIIFFVLGGGLTVLSCFVYKKRLSEWSGKPMPNEKLRIILTCLFSLPFLIIATHYLLSFFMSAYSDTYFDHDFAPTIGVLFLVALASWFGVEFITTKKVSSSVTSILRFPILIGVCAVYATLCLCIRGSVLSFRPDADSVEGVMFDGFSNNSVSEYAAVSEHFISDPDIVNYACYHLDVSTSDVIRDHQWNDSIFTHKITFKMKSGATVTRDVCLPDYDIRDILLFSLDTDDDYTGTVTSLPAGANFTLASWLGSYYTTSQSDLIWESFCEEYSESSFEEKAECKRLAFDGSSAPVINVYANYTEYPIIDCMGDAATATRYSETYCFGVPASFTRTRQLMLELAASSPDYSGDRLLTTVFNIIIRANGSSALDLSYPSFTVVSKGEDIFREPIDPENINSSILESVFTSLLLDDKLTENADPSASESYVAIKINVDVGDDSEGSYATVFYAVTDETAEYIAQALKDMQE